MKRPTGQTWDSKQTQTKVCRVCDARFFTQVGLDEHLRVGEHSTRPLVLRRRSPTKPVQRRLTPLLVETGVRVAALNNSQRRRCDRCGLESTPAAIGQPPEAPRTHRLDGRGMNAEPAPELRPCVIKGCSWRGPDPYACPMHDDSAWDRQWELLPGDGEGKRRGS